MADLNSADILGVDWARRARELLAGARPSRPKEKTPPEIWQGGTFRTEPVEIKQKNVLTDPNSWLNRGLEQLGRNAVDAVFGEESGNALVDYGASNIPGVGAGAILAAGGMPGLVDVSGLGALKHSKKLMKPVRDFIMRNAGEEGLRAVDNYIDKFPKVEKLTMADADYLLTSGKLGKRFEVTYPGAEGMLSEFENNLDAIKTYQDKLLDKYGHFDPHDPSRLLWIDDEGQNAISWTARLRDLAEESVSAYKKGDIAEGSAMYNASLRFLDALQDPRNSAKLRELGPDKVKEHYIKQARKSNEYDAMSGRNDFNDPVTGEYMLVQMTPIQDFEKIEARQAEKAAKKAAKQPQPQVTPEPVPEPIVDPVPEPVQELVPEPPKGGPNKWRENNWTSEEHPIDAYSILNPKATEEDRRAMFVMDSLANEAVSKLIRNNRFKDEWPGASKLRHQGTNYDTKSREYGQDVAWNARTGNLPDNTSSLVLRTAVSSAGNRLPGQMTGVVDGKDLYDLLFRKKVDKKINELDNRYRVDF
jgi:hypothetical protein